MTDTPPRAVSRRQARRAAFVLTYQLDVRAGSDLDELAVRYLADTGMEVPAYTREAVEGVLRDQSAIDAAVDGAAAGWTADRLGAGRARDPAPRDAGSCAAASCRPRSSSTRPSSSRSATRGPRRRRS